MKEFYYCVILIVFCIYDFHIEQKNKYAIGLITLSTFICFYFVARLDPNAFDVQGKTSKKGYFEQFESFTATSGVKLFPNQSRYPDYILNKIGKNTVDAYPWNTQVLFENRLNFMPRPVFQSYTAYTPKLEELNFDYYNSDKASKYVVYEFEGIDDRYAMFDEPKLNLIFTKNYTCVDTLKVGERLALLLEKKEVHKKIRFVQTNEYAMYMDSPLVPKAGVYYKVFLYPNLLGDFVSLINHSPEILLAVVTKDGNARHYKTSKGLLESGVFGTQHIVATLDFRDFLANKINDQKQVMGYYFKPQTKFLFKDKIRIIEYKITEQ